MVLRDDHPQEPGIGVPAVVIPLTTQHYPMLQRNLLYTAVTRGKRLVVIIGQETPPVEAPVLVAAGASAAPLSRSNYPEHYGCGFHRRPSRISR